MNETLPYDRDELDPREGGDSSRARERHHFMTTSWSLVVQAADPNSQESRLALETLCKEYWYPLYVFVRRKGHSRDDAEELTQAFFAHLLDQNRLKVADEEKGRFRSFLLRSMENFMVQQWRRETAQKRGGNVQLLQLDYENADRRYSREPADPLTAEHSFNRKWALQILNQVIQQLEEDYRHRGKGQLFEAMKPHLIQQSTEPWREVAERLEMSEIALKVAAHRMRQKFRDLLCRTIGQTVDDEASIDSEIAELFDALSSR